MTGLRAGSPGRVWLVALTLSAIVAIRVPAASAQRLTGEWRDGLAVHVVQLDLRHDPATAQVSGKLSLFGLSSTVSGPARETTFEISSVNGLAAAASLVGVTGYLDGDVLVLRIAEKGEPPMAFRLHRSAESTSSSSGAPASVGQRATPRRVLSSIASSVRSGVGTAAGAVRDLRQGSSAEHDAFGGSWEFASDDATHRERLELEVNGSQVSGTFTSFQHGYFSGRTTTDAELRVEGAVRDGRLELRLIDPASGRSVPATARRRGAYLILSAGDRETGYARPGTPLVQSAEQSVEARNLLAAVSGRVYQASNGASSRGSFVGGRTRLALCANGDIAYDASNLAATSGPSFGSTADLGSSVSRRGKWSIVLYAGAPMIAAHWNGTGTSYSLTAYFDVRPLTDGRGADVNGQRLPVTGRC